MKIGYLRVSTENQKSDGTIDIQKNEVEVFARTNGFEIDRFFMDNGVSGVKDLDDRKGLADLFDFIENNEVEEVIIYKLDRLARDVGLQEYLIRQMKKYGVKLVSVNDKDIDDDQQRKLFIVMLGAIADYERSLIDMRMTAGRLNKAKKGYAGGYPALGYKTKGKELVVDGENAKTIKNIFHMKRYKRYSMNRIAELLNKENIATARGGKWYASTIKSILDNKTYTKGILNYKGVESHKGDLRLI